MTIPLTALATLVIRTVEAWRDLRASRAVLDGWTPTELEDIGLLRSGGALRPSPAGPRRSVKGPSPP